MLSNEKCKQILEINNEKISEEEITAFRDMLYAIAETAIETILVREESDENSSDYVQSKL
jgi:hypothetical protein